MDGMKERGWKRMVTILVIIGLIVLNLVTAYAYSKLLQRRNVDQFAGTYQYLSIMNEEDENAFYIYDGYGKCTAAGTYEKVEENGISLYVEGRLFAALIYSNDKFYYVEEDQGVVVVDRIADSPLYYEQ